MRIILALAMALMASACATHGAPAREEQTLIVISLDGFRADYLQRGGAPNIAALAQDGVRSEGMRPAFPSVTQPNHYTLMTGLTPDHHGVIDNTMVDPNIPGWFGGPDPQVQRDPRWWEQATPLWVSAEQQGVRAGVQQWPGGDIAIHGQLASARHAYEPTQTPEQRVDEVLGWLDRPQAERPRFVAMYFGPIDDAGHVYGPNSPQVNEAVALADAAVGRLVAGLRARGMMETTNLVILADHGMTEVSTSERLIVVDDFLDMSKADIVAYGAVIGIVPRAGHEEEVAGAMLAAHEHMQCWLKANIPAHLRYGTHARVPPIFCLAEPGWLILTRQIGAYAQRLYPNGFRGNHGYDPGSPEMAALFVAHGPAFRDGVVIPPFDNVNVYSMLAHVLGIAPQPNDGNLAVLRPALEN